jgi:PAS domain S-box-containing protein
MESGQAVMQINKFASQALTTRNAGHISNSGPPEFTRRKNWSQNVLEELRDVIHVLSSDLNVLYCSPASREFLGYQPAELMGHSFTEYIHVDDVDIFTREFRTAQQNGSIMRVTYRLLRKDGKYTTLETRGHFFKEGFFGSARSVPSEMTRMMDTLLDYKMENEMLKRQVQIAKQKASSGKAHNPSTQEPSPQTSHHAPGSSTAGLSFNYNNSNNNENEDEDEYEDDIEELFAPSSSVYAQGVLNSYGVSESVSLFTGLHFDLGERSRGISMGIEGELFNTLIAPQIVDESGAQNETSDKLKSGKKRRSDDHHERICTDCGRTDAPEWRRGPRGPKT